MSIIGIMEANKTDIQKQIEERIRIQKLKNLTRACKDKLYERCYKERKQK